MKYFDCACDLYYVTAFKSIFGFLKRYKKFNETLLNFREFVKKEATKQANLLANQQNTTPLAIQYSGLIVYSPPLDPAVFRLNCLVYGTRNQNDICHDMFSKWN